MEWLVMDAEILSFMKQFHLWYGDATNLLI